MRPANGAAALIGAAIALAGCANTEIARFRPGPGQEALVRDGRPAIISRRPGSIVMVSMASRELQAGGRPVLVLALFNPRRQAITFTLSGVAVEQMRDGQPSASLKVLTYEELVAEERNRQIAHGLLAVLAASAGAYSAAYAGRYTATGTVYSPRGISTIQVSGYDPTAAAIVQSRVAADNEAMFANVVETGQRNLANLERTIIKDNTLMPGEWYGGQLHISPLISDSEKAYRISVAIAGEVHQIDVRHEAAGR